MYMLCKYVLLVCFCLTVYSCQEAPDKAPEVPPNPTEFKSKSPQVDNNSSTEAVSSEAVQAHEDAIPAPPKPELVVPSNVKETWRAVKFSIVVKEDNKTESIVVDIGKEYEIHAGLTLKVIAFLPDFKMDSVTITSVTNTPNNPAAKVEIEENGKNIFTGWLYSKYPDIHPFEHQKYAVLLVEGISK